MTRDNETLAYFTLVGDFEPSMVSELLGLVPSGSWRKGDRNEKTHIERKHSRWSLSSRLSRSAPLEQHLDDVLEQLAPACAAIVTARASYEGWIQMVGYFYKDCPGMTFEPSVLAKLGLMNLGMDFDFYYLDSDKQEDS